MAPQRNDRIYDKCSIPSLLVETPENQNQKLLKDNEELYNSLNFINISLHNALRRYFASGIFDYARMNSEAQRASKEILRLLKWKSQLGENEQKMLSKINRSAKAIVLLIKEKESLHNETNRFKKSYFEKLHQNSIQSEPSTKQEMVFNVITQNMINEFGSDKIPNKGRRLPKSLVQILETWYEENIESPYLSEETLTLLVERTGLTKNQVRNWISNKRRKEKVVNISEELSYLLK
ncbi:hypothetical protein PACTADRAFT_80619 [Pachysolen tannophilus NRRL Y-2460]|uniref:Homeobox domain-containing protein n=1 Tax=Pachysolen tannophilus NRRL Y-2460 TaxID=669874 RepID=A0A1E4TU48_PACTA|nr:hypothetical protein PACTADRAFT_80619 [Pachysolen tannophilus NRRL Y-2460]